MRGKPAAAPAVEPAAAPAVEPAETPVPPGVSIANHPRARAAIRRARARVALGGFGLVLLLALHAGVPAEEAVMRALVTGIAGFLAAWAIGLALWKHVVVAELRAAHARREERRGALAEAAVAEETRRRELAAAASDPAV